ncbi:MAG: YlxR family protein [Erysipelotrichaceae bacterium]|nr:YlxR family protein [Erysipelotrichaceae bacterium]
MKKIPMRRCLATNQSFPKKDLLRVVRTPEGEIKVDLTGKQNGKGAYISRSMEALQIARNKKVLNRALETEIPEEIYQEIERIING